MVTQGRRSSGSTRYAYPRAPAGLDAHVVPRPAVALRARRRSARPPALCLRLRAAELGELRDRDPRYDDRGVQRVVELIGLGHRGWGQDVHRLGYGVGVERAVRVAAGRGTDPELVG